MTRRSERVANTTRKPQALFEKGHAVKDGRRVGRIVSVEEGEDGMPSYKIEFGENEIVYKSHQWVNENWYEVPHPSAKKKNRGKRKADEDSIVRKKTKVRSMRHLIVEPKF